MRAVLTAVLALKLLLLALIVLSHELAPGVFNVATYEVNGHGDAPAGSLEAMLSTWDGQHYLALAERGYAGSRRLSHAFYPLWPWLVGAAAPPFGGALAAGLVLSHALFLLACALLYRYVLRTDGSPAAAATAVLVLAASPGAFYFGLIYSESLFLCLSIALFSFARERGRAAWLALLPALLLPLSRPVGVLAVAPLALAAWRAQRAGALEPAHVAAALAPLAGFAAYLLWMQAATGSPFSGFEVQSLYASQASIAKLFQPLAFAREFFDVRDLLALRHGAFDRALFLVYAALLLPLLRRDPVEFTWALALGVVPAVSMSLMAFIRYLAVIFPLAALAGVYLARPEQRGRRIRVLALCTGFQLLLFVLHVNNHWVA